MTHSSGSASNVLPADSSCAGGASHTTALPGRSRRRGSWQEEDGCNAICYLVGIFLGTVLCIRKLSLRKRIAVIWFWVIGATLTSFLLIIYHFYGPWTFEAAGNDMRLLNGKVSTFLCSGLKIESDEYFNAYLMFERPGINPGIKEYNIPRRSTCISKGTYEYWGYHLLNGSSIKINTCPITGPVEFFFIKGQGNLNSWIDDAYWKDDDYCTHCYVSHKKYDQTTCYKYDYYVHESDDFYFLYTSRKNGPRTACIDIKIQLNRTSYNTAGAKDTCTSATKCDFKFLWNSKEMVVYECVDTSRDDVQTASTCTFNGILMVCFFLLLPGCLGIFLSLSVYYCIKCGTDDVSTSGSATNEAPTHISDASVDNISVCSTSRLVPPLYPEPPPKYDDIVFGEQPPSYGSISYGSINT